jgi:hypothetical protein
VVLVDGDAEEDVGGLHGLAVVGDDDELRVLFELGEDAGETAGVGFVEGGVDFVEDDEGAGVNAEDGRQEGDAGQRALTAGESGDGGQALAGRRGFYGDAVRTLGVLGELERGGAAFEQTRSRWRTGRQGRGSCL